MLKMLKGDHVVGIREAFKKKGKIYLIFEFFPGNLLNLIEADSEGLQVFYFQYFIDKDDSADCIQDCKMLEVFASKECHSQGYKAIKYFVKLKP